MQIPMVDTGVGDVADTSCRSPSIALPLIQDIPVGESVGMYLYEVCVLKKRYTYSYTFFSYIMQCK